MRQVACQSDELFDFICELHGLGFVFMALLSQPIGRDPWERSRVMHFFTGEELTPAGVDYLANFVDENRERPFLLYLAYPAPHMGYLPVPEEDMAPYRNKAFELPDYKKFPLATTVALPHGANSS